MFANPLWSVLLLCIPVAIYFLVIRPRLKANFTKTYDYIQNWEERWWLRIKAFRTPIVAAMGPLLTALPDLLVLIPTLDLSFLPQPWPAYAMGASTFGVMLMKAFETKPDGVKAA